MVRTVPRSPISFSFFLGGGGVQSRGGERHDPICVILVYIAALLPSIESSRDIYFFLFVMLTNVYVLNYFV